MEQIERVVLCFIFCCINIHEQFSYLFDPNTHEQYTTSCVEKIEHVVLRLIVGFINIHEQFIYLFDRNTHEQYTTSCLERIELSVGMCVFFFCSCFWCFLRLNIFSLPEWCNNSKFFIFGLSTTKYSPDRVLSDGLIPMYI